jgi:hypothetical protein
VATDHRADREEVRLHVLLGVLRDGDGGTDGGGDELLLDVKNYHPKVGHIQAHNHPVL